jgi:hypothetical protein
VNYALTAKSTFSTNRKRLFASKSIFMGSYNFFYHHGSLHLKNILIYIQQDATLHSLFISGNCSTCFGCYLRQSSGAQTTVSTASLIWYLVYHTQTSSNTSTIAAGSRNGVTNTRCCR